MNRMNEMDKMDRDKNKKGRYIRNVLKFLYTGI